MVGMATEKNPKKTGKRGRPPVEKPKPREGRNLNVWVSAVIGDTLDAFVEQSRPQTFHKAVVEDALREYFEKRRFLPPHASPS
jgi:hypothetical protein